MCVETVEAEGDAGVLFFIENYTPFMFHGHHLLICLHRVNYMKCFQPRVHTPCKISINGQIYFTRSQCPSRRGKSGIHASLFSVLGDT